MISHCFEARHSKPGMSSSPVHQVLDGHGFQPASYTVQSSSARQAEHEADHLFSSSTRLRMCPTPQHIIMVYFHVQGYSSFTIFVKLRSK